MASELRVNTLKDAAGANSVAMEYVANGSAKAWVRFELVGTLSTLGSFNISSVEDLGVGAGRPNHTNNMSAADYSLVGGNALGGAHAFSEHAAGALNITSQHRVTARNDAGTLIDADMLCSTIFGDLA